MQVGVTTNVKPQVHALAVLQASRSTASAASSNGWSCLVDCGAAGRCAFSSTAGWCRAWCRADRWPRRCWGRIATARCHACGMPLVCDAEELTVDSLTFAPIAERPNNPLDPRTIAGDRLLIDRATLGVRSPRRWEVVVFHCPSHAHDSCVKRIVGLPGETVEVRDGDVYIDGQIARKTLDEQRAMANWSTIRRIAIRSCRRAGRPAVSGSAWHTTANGGWRHSSLDGDRTGADRLAHVHPSPPRAGFARAD